MKLRNFSKIVPFTLIATLAIVGVCYADDEDDQPLTKQYGLGEEPPPKPTVIKKTVTKIVNQCPKGFFWDADAKKCLDEDGDELVPMRKQAPPPRQQTTQTSHNDRYVYPGTKLRLKLDKCTMLGETVKCLVLVSNTAQGNTYTPFTDATITDDLGAVYKVQSQRYAQGANCYGPSLCYGETATVQLTFPLVNPAATSLSFATLLEANNGSDFIKFNGIPILK